MARGRWPGRVRIGHRRRRPHPALPRAAARRDHAADRPHGAGHRARGVARDRGRHLRAQRPALRSGRDPSRRPRADRRVPHEPWPKWTFRAEDGTLVEPGDPRLPRRRGVVACCAGRLRGRCPPTGRLHVVRPLLSGRDYHALHHENGGFDFAAEVTGARVLWRPYSGRAGDLGDRRTAATARTPSGTATSSTMPSARAASTSSRTWPRRASSAGR